MSFKSKPFIAGFVFVSGVSLVPAPSHAQNADEPDLNREKRFHNIYQKFNSQPTSPEVWSGVLSGKTQVYSVQEEDTLWDVSETLFGDAKYWPKVWSLNSQKIENPHEIFPGQVVQFTPGTVGEAPSLSLGLQSEMPEEEEAAVPANSENKELLSKAEIPPEPKRNPVAKIPESMPSWTMGRRKPAELQLELLPRERNSAPAVESLPYYIESQKVSGMGYITETEMVGDVAGDYQIVYVKLPMAPVEKVLLAVKEKGLVEDPVSNAKGYLMQVQGELEILEPVNGAEGIYRAMVRRSINPVEVGAQLVASEIPKYTSSPEGVGSASARVIGGQFEPERKMFDSHSILFLNGQGLAVGQTYPIFKQQVIRNKKTQSFENPRRIGKVKIVKASDSMATAVVVESTEEIRVGDVTDPSMRTVQ